MTEPTSEFEQLLKVRHREVHVVSSLVILALAGGIALLWPSVQDAMIDRFGPRFPARFLLGELLALVVLFVVYLWRKARQITRLVHHLLDERGRGNVLEIRLAQARAVLQASAQLDLDDDATHSLEPILECVTEALGACRGVLYRQRSEGRALQREADFPPVADPLDPLTLAFEDEIARSVFVRGEPLIVDEATNLKEQEIHTVRPRKGWQRLIAVPLLVDGKPLGSLLLVDRDDASDSPTREPDPARLELCELFADFAAGVLRNLRTFQSVRRRNEELIRTRQLLCDHQRELAEIDAIATMTRVAKSLAHGLSGPLTAIAGFTDVVLTAKPDALTLKSARAGLRREIDALRSRLQKVVEFTQTWRRAFGVVELNSVVETAVALQSEPLRTQGATCRFDAHSGLPFTVADPVRLRQLVLNVLAFVRSSLAPDAKGQEVRVRTLADAGTLRLHVDFRGRPGLVEESQPLLDQNVEIATLAHERSLDLPVAVSIARDHRGDLRIEALDEKVTRVAIELPVQCEAPVSSAAATSPDSPIEQVLSSLFDEPAQEPVTAPPARADATVPPPASRGTLLEQAELAGTLTLFDATGEPQPPA